MNPFLKNLFQSRGAVLDKGAIYVVVILTLLIFGGYILVGGTLPTKLPNVNTNIVNLIPISVEPSKTSLQMFTFYGVTPTPYPTLPPLPTSSNSDPTLIDCNRDITGNQLSQMIWGFSFDQPPTAASENQPAFKAFYTSRNSLVLGSGVVSPMNQNPSGNTINPAIGDTTAKDTNNFVYYPSTFITDITGAANDASGDSQAGGIPNKPDYIYGTWKALGAVDPGANGLTLGTNEDALPAANGPPGDHNQTYSSEIVWKIANLKTKDNASLIPGHKYRIQIALHDGATPTNIGVACVQLNLPGTAPTPTGGSSICMSPKDNLFLNPFNKNSAQHRPIGSGAVYATDADAATVAWKRGSAIYINIGANWGSVFTESQPTDPTTTVSGGGPGLPVSMKIAPGSGGSTSDSGADVYDPTTETLHEFYQFVAAGGGYTSSLHRPSSIRGLGHGTPQAGVTASGISLVVGLLRGHEANTAGYKIEHVLNLAVPSRPGDMGGVEMLGRQINWPANNSDGFCSVGGNCNGPIPYGALMAIPPEAQGGPNLDSLGLSEPGRRVAQALRDYGAYVMDTSGGVTMRSDQTLNAGVATQIRNDLAKVYQYVRMVKNNDGSLAVSGGGTQLAPNCAFDAQ